MSPRGLVTQSQRSCTHPATNVDSTNNNSTRLKTMRHELILTHRLDSLMPGTQPWRDYSSAGHMMVSTEHQHPLAAGWLATCGPAGAQGFAIGIRQDGGGSGLLLWSDNEPCVYREARFRKEIVVLCEQPPGVMVVRRRIGSGHQVP